MSGCEATRVRRTILFFFRSRCTFVRSRRRRPTVVRAQRSHASVLHSVRGGPRPSYGPILLPGEYREGDTRAGGRLHGASRERQNVGELEVRPSESWRRKTNSHVRAPGSMSRCQRETSKTRVNSPRGRPYLVGATFKSNFRERVASILTVLTSLDVP